MKAIRVHAFGGPEVLQLEEIPSKPPAPSEILIDIKAAGVNPVDAYILSGAYVLKPVLPFTPGMDAAGIVKEVGKQVATFKPGDRVYLSGNNLGTYAQQVTCSADYVFSLTDNLSFEQGAAIGVPYATAYRALFMKAKAVANESVLVHGASGGVGLAVIQLAKTAGLKVFATAGSESGRKLIKEQGADYVFDHFQAGYMEKVLAATQGRGVDIIVEMLANVNLAEDLKILARYGRVVVVGSRGTVTINPRDLMGREATVLGMALLTLPIDERQKIYQSLDSGFRSGQLKPVVGKKYDLAQAAEAHRAIMQKGAGGKIILIP